MTEDTRHADTDLVARLRRGEESAYEDLYRRHGSRIYNLAWRMLGGAADAEDLLQDVFVQAFRKIGSFKGDSALGTWLHRMAVNLCLDRLRSRAGREQERTASLDAEEMIAVSPVPADLPITRLDIERAIAQLPDGCRAVFLLHDVEGFEHREIGEMLSIAEGTSKSQVHKARMRIRRFLATRSLDMAHGAPARDTSLT